jgi:AcrR family transcriptional regulator
MGRKSLTAERQTLILDATERCIVKYGLQGVTLENIADEAGINRGLIHHYVGNRNDVIKSMVDRLFEKYQVSFDAYASTRPTGNRADAIVDYHFDAWFELAPDDESIILALFSESERDRHIKKVLTKLYDKFEKTIAGELSQFFPSANTERLHLVAYTIMSLAFGHAIMTWTGLPQAKKADLREIATNLVQTLV